ncbi:MULTISPECIES: hydrogenase nickel incorporation protein HypB [unclassified Candidatus Frackibacter]|uniref:hydrogenase nickel incorporation protein HypB n=1 Tax=unclassified Candidatus Frackibacter TaxID=2648818 RepID=UPI0008877ACA|nr:MULTISPECIES: hydrogenase nickel incorporation protein HypB [unclassified Candidatus Frackibacter]SDC77366.1 Hydrogenase nickel incorporation protein HypB [Candidatus Frackibacter sp. WG11]SEM90439.1 Hydrogenase nickel incorporation protein HypB [Candidatus Frackibacter sp. WG12]SFM00261.1 Hydrogenase nickel incorporation protein HypB [Candidatus Frackibacter sp. WG13]
MAKIKVVSDVLQANDVLADCNQRLLREKNIWSINFMGSPGAGKTTVLEKTVKELRNTLDIGVIEGDIYTAKDAERIEKYDIPVIQINTDGGCHLDANMVQKALEDFDLNLLNLMVIENVGNLVCPSDFALGEEAKVMAMSITEGADKPLKYPSMFRNSEVLLLNKMDLLPACDFDMDAFEEDVYSINPGIEIIKVSAIKEEGLEEWYQWLIAKVEEVQECA